MKTIKIENAAIHQTRFAKSKLFLPGHVKFAIALIQSF
jgi:hypothetical protein